jgi:cysteinyl-tRNA synthetase
LRNFAARLNSGKFPEGVSALSEGAERARQDFDHGLGDDLNTAQALAAVFDLVREANAAMDRGDFRQGDVAAVRRTLDSFETIFAVLHDDDEAKLRSIGMEQHASGPSDAEIEGLVSARQAARKARDFAKADRLRDELANQGIVLEDSKDGVIRWKRK